MYTILFRFPTKKKLFAFERFLFNIHNKKPYKKNRFVQLSLRHFFRSATKTKFPFIHLFHLHLFEYWNTYPVFGFSWAKTTAAHLIIIIFEFNDRTHSAIKCPGIVNKRSNDNETNIEPSIDPRTEKLFIF